MVTDRPPWRLELDESASAQDLIATRGVARQRRGWAYDGTAKFDTADDGAGIIRVKHVLADDVQTLVSDDDEDIHVHNGNSAGTSLNPPTKFPASGGSFNARWLPRAVYRDEVLWCEQSGESPLIRTSGATHSSTITGPTTQTITPETSQIRATAGSWSEAADAGAFLEFDLSGPWRYPRLTVAATDEITMDNLRPTNMSSVAGNVEINSWGYAFPCVGVDADGTLSISGSTATGVGTEWFTKGHIIDSDAFLVYNGTADSKTQHFTVGIDAIGSDTSVTVTSVSPRVGSGSATNSAYETLRRMPFKDVATHKGSLWGAGVKQHPSRVYVGRPGWDITNPPGVGTGVGDPDEDTMSTDASHFLMDYIDVPGDRDSDPIVAILPSPGPLLVLKRNKVYGVFGTYPNFNVELIADGAGCVDIRSAVSLEWGPFWAGEDGVYTYAGGQAVNLMRGKIGREWQDFVSFYYDAHAVYDDTDRINISSVRGHLVVHGTGATEQRTYVAEYDTFNPYQTKWMSQFSNVNPTAVASCRIPGEPEKLLWTSADEQGRVMDLAPCFDPRTQTIVTSEPEDGDGTYPRMQATTTSRLPQQGGVDVEHRLEDVHVHSVIRDSFANSTTEVDVDVIHSGGLRSGSSTATTKNAGTIGSRTDFELSMEEFGQVNTDGRLHQISVDTSTTDETNQVVEIAEIVLTFRGSRARS